MVVAEFLQNYPLVAVRILLEEQNLSDFLALVLPHQKRGYDFGKKDRLAQREQRILGENSRSGGRAPGAPACGGHIAPFVTAFILPHV